MGAAVAQWLARLPAGLVVLDLFFHWSGFTFFSEPKYGTRKSSWEVVKATWMWCQEKFFGSGQYSLNVVPREVIGKWSIQPKSGTKRISLEVVKTTGVILTSPIMCWLSLKIGNKPNMFTRHGRGFFGLSWHHDWLDLIKWIAGNSLGG